jgi:hypothetical protein
MQRFVIEYGAYNTTFWLVLLVAIALAARRMPSPHWRGWKPLAVAMMLGTALNVSVGLYRAYVAPRDLMQDIVSAQEYLAGRSMYPDNMQEVMQRTLEAEGQRRKLPLGSTVGQYSDQSNQSTLHQHWVQAHPPFMTQFVALFVHFFGVLGTQIAFAAIAFLSWGVSVFILLRELRPKWGIWATVTVAAASLGAAPLITSIRNGQSDLLLAAILIACWALARRGKSVSAGVVLGLAISFKLVPALLLPIFLVRWPRAFFAALGVHALAMLLVLAGAVDGDFQRYRATAAGVIEEYANYASNLSLLGFLSRGAGQCGLSVADVKSIWLAIGLLIAAGLMWLARRPAADPRRQTDLLFGLGVSLIPLCSPVAWDHYLAFLLLPLTLAALSGMSKTLLASLLLLWCIPETAWLNFFGLLTAHQMRSLAVWLFEPLRTYALIVLVGWFVRMLIAKPQTGRAR